MDEFTRLLTTIEDLLSIRCGQYKEDYIKRRLFSRMNATNSKNYTDYRKFLLSDPNEAEKLKNALTINVTKFYRDPEIFEAVKRDLLPSILKKRTRIRIWSAGCSSGEEPYSYAMILTELGLFRKDLDGMVIATDIDREILKKASEGIYEASALENLSESQIRRHFIKRPDGKFEVKPALKEKVRFQAHDLMRGVPVSRGLDIISCRNVTIYFTEEQKNDLNRMFFGALAQDGYYIIGMSEFLGKDIATLFKAYRPREKVFVKNLPGAQDPLPKR